MIRNYFIIAMRNIRKNGIYSAINITGLSVGIACSIMILLWVSHELSWDQFHEKKDRLYRVYVSGQGDNGIFTQMAVPLPLWEEFRNDRDFAHVAPTNWGQDFLLSHGEQRMYKRGYYAGDDFLKMFSFPVTKGNPESQLSDPSTIVLDQSTATALFGDDDPIGKVIRVDDRLDLTVTGVVGDVPDNSSFRFQCLVPFTAYMNREPWVKNALTTWGNNSFNMYVELAENSDAEQVKERVKGLIKSKVEETTMEVTLHPVARWRLYSDFKNGKSVGGQILYVKMFTIIAVFILVIACINFMNLATARSERRAREVGIRKSIGSKRIDLIFQFLGETFVIASVAFFIALGLAEGFLPLFNGIVDKKLFIDYANPVFWIASAAMITLTGLLAGSYPAFYLSSFQAARVLKGTVKTGRGGTIPRKLMVTMQFFFSIALIIATVVVYQQIHHLKNRPVGYDQDNLVMVSNTGDIRKNYDVIKHELLSGGIAESVTSSSSPVTAIYAFMGDVTWQGKREDQRAAMATVATGFDYTKTLGMQLKQGRDFSEDFNDSTSIILNEAAVNYMGLKDPIGETIRWDDREYRVIGVLGDVVMNSPNKSVDPTMFVFDPTWMADVTIRISPQLSTSEALSKLESVFKAYNPAYPFSYRFASDEFRRKFAGIQLIGNLANTFSFLAILISCLGLFGLAAFTAEQRTKEIGIRKVMGASVSGLVRLMSKDFTVLVIIAFTLAAPLGYWVMNNWLLQYEYRIELGWWIPAFAGGVAFTLSMAVVSYQAVKAAVANPVSSLRNE
jgi:putative ABC transport system permease protein